MNIPTLSASVSHSHQSPSYKTQVLDYLTLCKPKVILVMLITSWVGMHLARPDTVPLNIFIFATLGIALAGGSAAVINHLVDAKVDAKMSRTLHRPLASKRISVKHAAVFSAIIGISGILILTFLVNPLTALLTLSTVFGYAVMYTLFLKRRTPQNIVIGGAAGAMPPLLGWAAVTNSLSAFPWLLVLIIFAWTPPHFWALAIYRKNDYQNADIPMLPITHGIPFTKLYVVLYTILLWTITLLPYIVHFSGILYLSTAILLGFVFFIQSIRLYQANMSNLNHIARQTFNFSILYLLLLFGVLMLDHYLILNLECMP